MLYRGNAWLFAILFLAGFASVLIGWWGIAATSLVVLVIWCDSIFGALALALVADLIWLVPGNVVHHPPLFIIATLTLIVVRRAAKVLL